MYDFRSNFCRAQMRNFPHWRWVCVSWGEFEESETAQHARLAFGLVISLLFFSYSQKFSAGKLHALRTRLRECDMVECENWKLETIRQEKKLLFSFHALSHAGNNFCFGRTTTDREHKYMWRDVNNMVPKKNTARKCEQIYTVEHEEILGGTSLSLSLFPLYSHSIQCLMAYKIRIMLLLLSEMDSSVNVGGSIVWVGLAWRFDVYVRNGETILSF